MTNRNGIKGQSLWEIDLWIKTPYSHSEERGVNPA
jgi:hypothetical protein